MAKIDKTIKPKLHPRNPHRTRYDFPTLIAALPELGQHVKPNKYNDDSIDFFDPEAVKLLNKALLKKYYDIDQWDIPEGYLCPPIPGRADYIHHLADLLAGGNTSEENSNLEKNIPQGGKIKCLDIGVGANSIYPIIGRKAYGWTFVGTDIDPVAIESAKKILAENPILGDRLKLRQQHNEYAIFTGIIQPNEYFDATICNPPFHASPHEAMAGSRRKLKSLKKRKVTETTLNFGGQKRELWCEGGEKAFINQMIRESKQFGNNCFWFTTLVSKKENLTDIYSALKNANAVLVKTIPMGQGNKVSRIVAWSFLTPEQRMKWAKLRWR